MNQTQTQTLPNTKVIKSALKYLAAQCDRARSLDGAGFSKWDADLGHRLAASEVLTPAEEALALHMLRKYKGQLAEAGITLPEADSKVRITMTPAGGVWVYFPSKPAEAVRSALKSMGARWQPNVEGTPWLVSANQASELLRLFPDAEVTQEVVEMAEFCLRQPPQTTQTSQPPHTPQTTQTSQPPHTPQTTQTSQTHDVIITEEGGKFYVKFAGASLMKNVEVVKKGLGDRKYVAEKRAWEVPAKEWANLLNLKFIGIVTLDPKAETLVSEMKRLSSGSRKASSEFKVEGLRGDLLPFQKAGVEELVARKGRAILGDEMGLGKTIQGIAYLQHNPQLRPAMVVCPATLKLNWKLEIEKWMTSSENVVVINGGSPYPVFETGATIVIINYDVLAKWEEYFKTHKPAVIIYDEAHYMKNETSQRGKAGKELAKIASQVICMTGTPLLNRPIELYPLLHMIDPKAWSSKMKFALRYCNAYQTRWGWDFSGASNLNELHEVVKPYMIRRTKAEVLAELPEKRYAPVLISLSKSALNEYDLVMRGVKDVIRKTEGNGSATANVLAEIERAKQAVAHAKLDQAIEWITNFLASDKKLVIFAVHSFVIDRLMEEYKGIAVKVDGSVSQKDRSEAVKKFQEDPKVKIFVGNIKAAGVGVTLTAASDVLFLEYPWTPGDMTQAIDRCHRIGQKSSVTAWMMGVAGTIEQKIIALLEGKRTVIEAVHDGKVTPESLNIFSELVKDLKSE